MAIREQYKDFYDEAMGVMREFGLTNKTSFGLRIVSNGRFFERMEGGAEFMPRTFEKAKSGLKDYAQRKRSGQGLSSKRGEPTQ